MKQVDALFGKAASDLEESFFLREDKKLLEKLKQMQKMEETKENLRAVSGISNDAVLQRLVELEVPPDIVASLAIVPLIEIAWADGSVTEKERAAVLKAADELGMGNDSNPNLLITQWLSHKPESKLMQAWLVYVSGLCELLTDTEKRELESELIGKARAIAEASGGFLGIGKVSASEERVLSQLASGLK